MPTNGAKTWVDSVEKIGAFPPLYSLLLSAAGYIIATENSIQRHLKLEEIASPLKGVIAGVSLVFFVSSLCVFLLWLYRLSIKWIGRYQTRANILRMLEDDLLLLSFDVIFKVKVIPRSLDDSEAFLDRGIAEVLVREDGIKYVKYKLWVFEYCQRRKFWLLNKIFKRYPHMADRLMMPINAGVEDPKRFLNAEIKNFFKENSSELILPATTRITLSSISIFELIDNIQNQVNKMIED